MWWPWRRGRGTPPGTPPRGADAPGPPYRRGRVELLWVDLAAAFTAYVVGLLVAGIALGGERARDVAVGNLVGVGLAVVTVAALMLRRRGR